MASAASKIERSTNGGAFAQIGTTAAGVSSYVDGSVSPGTTYSYRVRAIGLLNDSAYSNTATVKALK